MKFSSATLLAALALSSASSTSAFVTRTSSTTHKTSPFSGQSTKYNSALQAWSQLLPPDKRNGAVSQPAVTSSSVSPVSPSTMDTSAAPTAEDAKAFTDIFASLQEKLTQMPETAEMKKAMGGSFLDGFSMDQIPVASDILGAIQNIKDQIQAIDTRILAELNTIATQVQTQIVQEYPSTLGPLFNKVNAFLQPLLLSPTLSILVSSVLTYFSVNALLSWGQAPPPSQPYPLNKYDPIAARAYFDRRLPLVLGRGLQIAVQSLQFGLGLLKDKLDGSLEEKEEQRGRELAMLLATLGPTFIKIGQSLSIRTDLLSPAYIRGLETLQDQVPPFDTEVAREILSEEWGCSVESVIESLPAKPVAAASLGQVYRATLKSNGQDVAIKVQRPQITEQIALDMHLLREAAPILKRSFNLNSDTVGTVDAWGTGFVDELDYIQEADSAAFFSEEILKTPLKDVVLAPTVVDELTTPQVLVTEWIDGQRLDQSKSEDVTVLCSIAMNTYLTMLLEIGMLHCDPHPGNLLRTPEGKLCILDWGMITKLDSDLQMTLIEHVAHLTSADYAEIPRDLLLLGFIPQNKANLIEDSGVVEVLADIYSQWTAGGGAAAINVNDVFNNIQDLTAEKGNLFQIPPYFAYIAKSFSVLEGIGLSNDPQYSIINECLPYVSKRLLTDKESGPALQTFIFGPNKNNADRIVEYDRVEQLIEGFGDYSTSASGALLGKENVTRVELLDQAADQLLDLVFTEEASPLQEIILDQAAKIVASSGRTLLSQFRENSGVLPSGRTLIGTLVDPLGLFRTSPLVRANEADERNVETMLKLFELARKQASNSPSPVFDLNDITREEAMALTSIFVRKFWERRRGLLQTGNRFVRRSLELVAEQLEKGERDSRRVPERPAVEARREVGETHSSPIEAASDRLQSARRLLQGYEAEEAAEAPVAEPVSYRRTFPAKKR